MHHGLPWVQERRWLPGELINVPVQGHQPPKGEWLKKAIEFLDAGKTVKKP